MQGGRISTSSEISRLAREIGKDEMRTIRYLQEHGYTDRLLRGIFYVRDQEEVARGSVREPVFGLISQALRQKGVRGWYCGLETALKLNGMTHEYFAVDTVITDSYRTTKVIEIMGCRYQFLRWSPVHFKFGLQKDGGVIYSDPEKSVLDISYKRMLDRRGREYSLSPIEEYRSSLDTNRARRYLGFFPEWFSRAVRERI